MKRRAVTIVAIVVLLLAAGLLLWWQPWQTPELFTFAGTVSTELQPAVGKSIAFASGLRHDPAAVAIDGHDRLYLVDDAANFVVKLTTAGAALASWSTFRPGRRDASEPNAIAVTPAGMLYLRKNGAGPLLRFTENGAFAGEWGARFAGAPFDTRALEGAPFAIDRDGRLHFAISGDSGVFLAVFDATGKLLAAPRVDVAGRPAALAIDPAGNTCLVDAARQQLRRFDLSGKEIRWPAGIVRTRRTPFAALYSDAAGNFYLADRNANRITQYTPAGARRTSWRAHLAYPVSLTADSLGNLYVVNAASQTLDKFSPLPPGRP